MWYETKVKYNNSLQKRVTETYLVDALSFTEAEARTIEFVSPCQLPTPKGMSLQKA